MPEMLDYERPVGIDWLAVAVGPASIGWGLMFAMFAPKPFSISPANANLFMFLIFEGGLVVGVLGIVARWRIARGRRLRGHWLAKIGVVLNGLLCVGAGVVAIAMR